MVKKTGFKDIARLVTGISSPADAERIRTELQTDPNGQKTEQLLDTGLARDEKVFFENKQAIWEKIQAAESSGKTADEGKKIIRPAFGRKKPVLAYFATAAAACLAFFFVLLSGPAEKNGFMVAAVSGTPRIFVNGKAVAVSRNKKLPDNFRIKLDAASRISIKNKNAHFRFIKKADVNVGISKAKGIIIRQKSGTLLAKVVKTGSQQLSIKTPHASLQVVGT